MTPYTPPSRVLTLPNIISGLRILAAPGVVWLLARESPSAVAWGITALVAMGISDVLDGAIARSFGQESKLGRILDPAADKILTASVFGLLAYMGRIPVWLFAAAFCRDLIIASASLALAPRYGAPPRSNTAGKLTFTSLWVLGVSAYAGWEGLARTLMPITCALMVLSLLLYARMALLVKAAGRPEPVPVRPGSVLLGYIVISMGHKHAAGAVRRAMEKNGPDSLTFHELDALAEGLPRVGPGVARSYLFVIRRLPFVWAAVYDSRLFMAMTGGRRRAVEERRAAHLLPLLQRVRPAVCVCTQAFPARVLALLRRRSLLTCPVIGVCTDFAPHRYWAEEGIDLFCVADEKAKAQLEERGVPAERVTVTGIPVDPAYTGNPTRDDARRRLGLPQDAFIVLLASGSLGVGPLTSALEAVLSARCPTTLHCLAATGSNDKVRRRLEAEPAENVTVLGYLPSLQTWLCACDVYVGKPGGLTAAECLATGTPMLLGWALPGQETLNRDRLIEEGTAMAADSPHQITGIIERLAADRELLAEMAENARRMGRPDAAARVARLALDASTRVTHQD